MVMPTFLQKLPVMLKDGLVVSELSEKVTAITYGTFLQLCHSNAAHCERCTNVLYQNTNLHKTTRSIINFYINKHYCIYS